MPATLLYGAEPVVAAGAVPEGDDLWLSPGDLLTATGWERKPQGLCRGDRFVPLPPQRERADAFNIAAFARYLGQPVVHDDALDVWAFGEAPADRRSALLSLHAPDFELPDLDGKLHALRDYRGMKVLLLSWASW